MTTRKLNKAQEIKLLENELFNRQVILEGLVKKFERTGFLSDSDRELARNCTNFINDNKDIVRNYYCPAMVIAE